MSRALKRCLSSFRARLARRRRCAPLVRALLLLLLCALLPRAVPLAPAQQARMAVAKPTEAHNTSSAAVPAAGAGAPAAAEAAADAAAAAPAAGGRDDAGDATLWKWLEDGGARMAFKPGYSAAGVRGGYATEDIPAGGVVRRVGWGWGWGAGSGGGNLTGRRQDRRVCGCGLCRGPPRLTYSGADARSRACRKGHARMVVHGQSSLPSHPGNLGLALAPLGCPPSPAPAPAPPNIHRP
jgi:hypothetical protein